MYVYYLYYFCLCSDTVAGSDSDNDFKNLPIFVKPIHSRGTVSSSLILVNTDGTFEFIEKTWTFDQEIKNESRIFGEFVK